jgi:hypothetical protein
MYLNTVNRSIIGGVTIGSNNNKSKIHYSTVCGEDLDL